jgi:uncharacterized protein
MYLYKVARPGKRAQELTGIIVDSAKEIEKTIKLLREHSKLKQMLTGCVEINRLENSADKVYRAALGELFDGTFDISDVIKWREIYEHLETATDRCEDVADALEGVALKNA